MPHLKVLNAADIPAAGTSVLTDPVISGLANVGHLTAQFSFDYGSGGTSVTAWLQTSLDNGVTWIDIACAKFLTTDAVKVFAVNAGGSLAAAFVPTDGALADDTVRDGLIGSLLRVKTTVVGTYVDSTLAVDVETRAGVGGAKVPATGQATAAESVPVVLASDHGVPVNVSATIADGQSLSAGVDLGGRALVGIETPAGWTTAVMTFQVSTDNSTWIEYEDVNGTAIQIPSTAASKYRAIDPADFISVRYLKVRSGTSGSAVAQSGGDVVTLVTRSVL